MSTGPEFNTCNLDEPWASGRLARGLKAVGSRPAEDVGLCSKLLTLRFDFTDGLMMGLICVAVPAQGQYA